MAFERGTSTSAQRLENGSQSSPRIDIVFPICDLQISEFLNRAKSPIARQSFSTGARKFVAMSDMNRLSDMQSTPTDTPTAVGRVSSLPLVGVRRYKTKI